MDGMVAKRQNKVLKKFEKDNFSRTINTIFKKLNCHQENLQNRFERLVKIRILGYFIKETFFKSLFFGM